MVSDIVLIIYGHRWQTLLGLSLSVPLHNDYGSCQSAGGMHLFKAVTVKPLHLSTGGLENACYRSVNSKHRCPSVMNYCIDNIMCSLRPSTDIYILTDYYCIGIDCST